MGFAQIWFSVVNWFIEAAPIITAIAALGSLLGGGAAIFALIFLARNLKVMQEEQRTSRGMLAEMQEQKKLENKGFLAINISAFCPIAKTPKSDTQIFRIYYRVLRTTRVPLLLKGPDSCREEP